MKIKSLLIMVAIAVFLSGCSKEEANTNTANTGNAAANNTSPANNKTPEFTGELKFPWDFPATDTTAKTGEYVLVPSFNWLVDAMQKDKDKVTMIWYSQKMSKPGAEKSEIQFMSDKKEVPNAYIIPIPPGEKAKNGDILLTWWQSGSGLQRAIVTDDSNPIEPVVRYLDLTYDNPAKSRDGKTTIGQMDEKLKPDTFVVIKNEMDPGTAVAITDGANLKYGQVIRVAGDKVFVTMFAGRVGVFPKADCKGVPLKPNVKEGDRVKALGMGNFVDATVTKVDAKIGRAWVKFDSNSKEEAIAFGNILPK